MESKRIGEGIKSAVRISRSRESYSPVCAEVLLHLTNVQGCEIGTFSVYDDIQFWSLIDYSNLRK